MEEFPGWGGRVVAKNMFCVFLMIRASHKRPGGDASIHRYYCIVFFLVGFKLLIHFCFSRVYIRSILGEIVAFNWLYIRKNMFLFVGCWDVCLCLFVMRACPVKSG